MANEISVTGTLNYANAALNITGISLALPSTNFSITNKNYIRSSDVVPTTAGGTAIPLGSVAVPGGWFFFKNNDATNYVDILNAVSGTSFLRILPGECAMGRFASTVTAPAALAHTATVLLEYLILEL